MRSKLNLSGSPNPRVADNLGMSRMPLEWLDAGSWRLPSGQALAEFALQAGFVAPLLFRKPGRGSRPPGGPKASPALEQSPVFSRSHVPGKEGDR